MRSRFSLSSDCRRQLIWRESGTAYRQKISRKRTDIRQQYHGVGRHHDQWPHAPVVANGTMTDQRYIGLSERRGYSTSRMASAFSDLNPIENVWDALRQVAGRTILRQTRTPSSVHSRNGIILCCRLSGTGGLLVSSQSLWLKTADRSGTATSVDGTPLATEDRPNSLFRSLEISSAVSAY
ncbi:hypothetical protein TNCV_1025921 [Trichonephila clavipes]|nr:hypothetical protein TNCV_1025921 [Trichonephila clavipes]